MKNNPSVYLTEKCETLETVFDFFVYGSHHKTINEKLLVFLHQIDFWEWEIDNLVFSFQNFSERSTAWDVEKTLTDLKFRGIIVKTNIDYDIGFGRYVRQYSEKKVVAPVEVLNRVICKWNRILDLCEERVMISESAAQDYINLKAQIIINLNKYRKSEFMPSVE